MLFYADKYNEITNHKIPMHAKAIQNHVASDIAGGYNFILF
jgi:hypothetical protein